MQEFVKNKKAQTGDTITWLVATVVIVVVLAVSIFAASIFFDKNKLASTNTGSLADTLASKSLFSYVLTKDANGKRVYDQLKEEENLNSFNGNLALSIFKEFYEDEYTNVWLGISADKLINPKTSNDYFGSAPTLKKSQPGVPTVDANSISEDIFLNDEKSLELFIRVN